MSDQITASFLHPERQSLEDVTQSLVGFLGSARHEVNGRPAVIERYADSDAAE